MTKKTDHWMPLYIGDYLADTGHLTTTQHGAYLLLLMHYWRKRELPEDDKQLAAIAKLSLRIWLDIKETIQAFFHDGWKHSRIESELARRSEVSSKRAAAGAKGGASKSEANATVLLKQTGSMVQSQLPEDRIVDAGASQFTEGSKALTAALWKAIGIESKLQVPPELAGTDWRAIEWERAGWTADLVETEARRIGPGKPLTYYEKVFATSFAKRQAPLPVVEIREAETLTVTHGRNEKTQSLSDVARRHAESGISFGERPTIPSLRVLAGGSDVRLLPQGGSERSGDIRGGDGGGS